MKFPVFLKIFFIVLLVFSCSDLERTNPLDPKNPNSESSRVVLVEAFVNSSVGEPITDAVNALAKLHQDFSKDNFIILEHHIEKTADTDPDASPESLNRYQNLVTANTEQAIPDVFFDGQTARVQGASSETTALNRYKIELESRVLASSQFVIELSQSYAGDQLTISAKIARLGSDDAEDLLIQLAVLEKKNNSNIVRHFTSMKAVNSLKAGEIITANKTVILESSWDRYNLVGVVFIDNTRTKQVMQTAVVED